MIRNKGFTLIEILVGMAIILILSSASYFGFVSFSRSQNLNIARDNLRNTLNEARSRALSQVVVNCSPNQTLFGHQIRFYSTYYEIEEVCRDVNSPYTITYPPPKKRVSLSTGSTGISFNPTPLSPILFLRSTGGISDVINRVVTLQNIVSQTRTVTVNPAGVISSN